MTETVHGYRLLRPLSTSGGGQSQWAFAERGGRQYFLKQFLAPTYPVKGAPGSQAMKRHKLEQCRRFESHHRKMMEALQGLWSEGGNLVVTLDFFRSGTRYYKTTAKVDGAAISAEQGARLELHRRIGVLVAISGSVQILHRMRIVHGDLKPANILVQGGDRPTPKLIDFDNAFLFGEPPDRDELVGDALFYSPELLAYVTTGMDGRLLTGASDVFALGLVFSGYLTGSLPGKRGQYPAEVLAAGGRLEIPSALAVPPRLNDLLGAMLHVDSARRPTMAQVWTELKEIQAGRDSRPPSPPKPDEARLRGALTKTLTGPAKPVLRGTLRTRMMPRRHPEIGSALTVLRGGAQANERVHSFWQLVQAIVRGHWPELTVIGQRELVDLLPDGLRSEYEALMTASHSDARGWAAALLAGQTPTTPETARLRPRPRPMVSSGLSCNVRGDIELPATPAAPVLAGSPTAFGDPAESDEVVARAAWMALKDSDNSEAKAVAYMRYRALATTLDHAEAELGNEAIRDWGSRL